ncbi:MAG: hypothetical protein QM820_58005 [Minicystis sp.]
MTQAEVDAQSSQPFEVGFCFNPFACFLCPDNAVNPGDVVCSPSCVCAPLPPICGTDAGVADAEVTVDAAMGAGGSPP